MLKSNLKASYLIIGNGRTAKHIKYYFDQLAISYRQWTIDSGIPLDPYIDQHERILLLISDNALVDFLKENPAIIGKAVHFSGCTLIKDVFSAHPLISFSTTFFTPDFYPIIPFIIEAEGPSFAELLPGLPNPAYTIPQALKPYYHSLAVISGNFSCLLWQKLFIELENTFHIPREAALPYLQSITHNLQKNPLHALTGPLARGDQTTINKNLEALRNANDPFITIYHAFLKYYQEPSL